MYLLLSCFTSFYLVLPSVFLAVWGLQTGSWPGRAAVTAQSAAQCRAKLKALRLVQAKGPLQPSDPNQPSQKPNTPQLQQQVALLLFRFFFFPPFFPSFSSFASFSPFASFASFSSPSTFWRRFPLSGDRMLPSFTEFLSRQVRKRVLDSSGGGEEEEEAFGSQPPPAKRSKAELEGILQVGLATTFATSAPWERERER